MVVKYSKVFTILSAVNKEPVTILVEYIESKDFKGIGIESLEGKYDSPEEFEKAYRHIIDKTKIEQYKIYNFLPMTLPDTNKFIDTLKDAIIASKKC